MLVDIWNKDPDYYEGYESFCFQNCLRLILQSYGVENAPLYVNTSIFLKFDSTNNNDVQLIVDKNNRSLLPDYLDKVTRGSRHHLGTGKSIAGLLLSSKVSNGGLICSLA